MTAPAPWAQLASALFGWRIPSGRSAWSDRVLQRANNDGVDLDALARHVEAGDGTARNRLAELGAVEETYFFRDPEALEAALLRTPSHGELKLWSAGCASGEEAVTLALLTRQLRPGSAFDVLGTDLRVEGIARARDGKYGAWSLRGPGAPRARSLLKPAGTGCAIPTAIAERLRFLAHNLLDPLPPGEGPFDLIVCRNVLIYFDPERAHRLVESFIRRLKPAGLVVLGAMELLAPPHGLVHATGCPAGVFQRAEPRASRPAPPNSAPPTSRAPLPRNPERVMDISPAVPVPDGQALQAQGMRALDTGALEQALESFQAALQINGTMPLAWLGQALVYLQKGASQEARYGAEQVLLLTANSAPTAPVPGGEDKMSVGQARSLAAQILEMG